MSEEEDTGVEVEGVLTVEVMGVEVQFVEEAVGLVAVEVMEDNGE